MKGLRLGALVVGVVLMVVGVGLAVAPYVFTEMVPLAERHGWAIAPASMIQRGPLPGAMAGTVVPAAHGRWRVQRIGPVVDGQATYALGEPANDPDNYEYLLVGQTRALLIDAGSTSEDIHPVLATLTKLPVTVIPTHLHFDHTNGLRNFSSIALVDVPETRGRVRDGLVRLSRYEYLGWDSPQGAPVFGVTEWVKPDEWIDLGGRMVQVLWTPGHTATSVSVWDPGAKLLFTGDLMYTTSLYAFLPDSSLGAYEATTERLLGMLPAGTVIYGAHCCRNDAPAEAPWLGMGDLKDVRDAVVKIRSGDAVGRGVVVRRFPVNSRMTMITLYPFGNR
jgi:hydroxyacylglutathione hydrolase